MQKRYNKNFNTITWKWLAWNLTALTIINPCNPMILPSSQWKLSLAAEQIFCGPSWGGSGYKRTLLQLLIIFKHISLFSWKSKVFPACVVMTIPWPCILAKILISCGHNFYELTEILPEEMRDDGTSWESEQMVSSPSMAPPVRPRILQLVSITLLTEL